MAISQLSLAPLRLSLSHTCYKWPEQGKDDMIIAHQDEGEMWHILGVSLSIVLRYWTQVVDYTKYNISLKGF